jgi:phospholipid/cholesterol/gamma-HCH transport system substrate-binding protein
MPPGPPLGPPPPPGQPRSPRRHLRPPSRAWAKTKVRLAGAAFLALLLVLAGLSVAVFNKDFSGDTMVTLYTDSTGNEMNIDADVQVKGVDVGQVRSITANGTGAKLELAINPQTAASLPANVTAEMLPTTLFGERYVSLVEPATPDTAPTLAQTRVVQQDRSADAVELETVLNDMLPMLTAVQPQKLSVTLTAIADTLQGRGRTLGQTLDAVNAYLKQFNPQLPQLDTDIDELVQVTQTYSQAAPGIIESLKDFSVTSQVVASEAANLDSLYSVVTGASGNLTSFLDQNQHNLIGLSAESGPTLKILAEYSKEFPCVFQQLAELIPNMDKVLGAGTGQPGLHANLTTVPAQAPYQAGTDTPQYTPQVCVAGQPCGGGPHCYATPFTTADASDAAGTGGIASDGTAAISTAGLGLPNSPQENELVTELISPQVNAAPDKLPDWSSVLVGPLYRGTETKVG